MTGPYTTTVPIVALLLAACALGLAAAYRTQRLSLVVDGLVLEALLIGFAIGGIVQMVGSDRHFARAEFVGYLLGALAIPPIAALWASGEKSRSGTVVIALGFLLTPVMVMRVPQVWAGPFV